jgi:hypothetical protein
MINIPVQTDGRHHDRAHEWLGIRSGSQQNDITDRLDYNGPTTRAAIQADAGDVQFALTPIQFRRIKTEGNPSPTVLEALRSHLVERGRNEPAPNMTLTGR